MKRARKDQGFTQKELGARVGTSQNIISEIEAGTVQSSGFIMPICRVLKIPAPKHYESEDDAAWSQLGHLLRTKNMKQFRRAMALVESMIEEDNETRPANEEARKPANRK